MEVAGDVEHESAVPEARSIHHADRRQREPHARSWRRQEAPQGLQTVEDARRRGTHDADTLDGIDDERVSLARALTFDGANLKSKGPDISLSGTTQVGPQVVRREGRFGPEGLRDRKSVV